jgi:hypothetical protein
MGGDFFSQLSAIYTANQGYLSTSFGCVRAFSAPFRPIVKSLRVCICYHRQLALDGTGTCHQPAISSSAWVLATNERRAEATASCTVVLCLVRYAALRSQNMTER